MKTLQINIEDAKLFDDIQDIIKKENISASQAVLLFFRWMQNEKGMPHPIAMFNNTTQKAIKDSYEKRDTRKCKDANDLFNRLAI